MKQKEFDERLNKFLDYLNALPPMKPKTLHDVAKAIGATVPTVQRYLLELRLANKIPQHIVIEKAGSATIILAGEKIASYGATLTEQDI